MDGQGLPEGDTEELLVDLPPVDHDECLVPEIFGHRSGSHDDKPGRHPPDIHLGHLAQQADHIGAVGVLDLFTGNHGDGRRGLEDVLLVPGSGVDSVQEFL